MQRIVSRIIVPNPNSSKLSLECTALLKWYNPQKTQFFHMEFFLKLTNITLQLYDNTSLFLPRFVNMATKEGTLMLPGSLSIKTGPRMLIKLLGQASRDIRQATHMDGVLV